MPPRVRFPALRVTLTLLRQRAPLQLALFLAAYAFSILNRTCMRLEDLLVPELARVPLDRVVLILGHHRSGTTNLHKELRQHPDCHVGTMLDLLFPSLFLNRLVRSRPVRWSAALLDRGVRRLWNTSHHAVGFDEELEEHLWLLHRVRSEALFVMLPALLSDADSARFAETITPTEADLVFVRRCLQRTLYGRPHAVYVARPLIFTMAPDLLRRHFPEARLVLCVREPAGAVRSHLAMTQQQMHCAPDDPRLVHWARLFYEAGTRRQYEGIRALLTDPTEQNRLLPVPFETLRRDTPGVLRRIVDFLGLPPCELAPVRSESHGGGASRPGIVEAETIERDLGETWRAIEAALSDEERDARAV